MYLTEHTEKENMFWPQMQYVVKQQITRWMEHWFKICFYNQFLQDWKRKPFARKNTISGFKQQVDTFSKQNIIILFTTTAEILNAHWLTFIVNNPTDT